MLDSSITARNVSDATGREVHLAGAFNVRDLGGLAAGPGRVTTQGLVYRADSLDLLTEGDKRVLFGERRVGTVLDLRTPEEAGGDGLSDARLFPAVEVRSFPVIPDGRIGVEPFPVGDPDAVAKLYLEYVVDRAPIVAGAIATIIGSVERGVPALFHCAAGRDRTGVVAAVLLAMLGVRTADIVADYVASNHHAEQVSRRLTLNPLYRGTTASPRSDGDNLVDPATIRQFLELFRVQFGTPRAWARHAGLTTTQLATAKRVLVAATR